MLFIWGPSDFFLILQLAEMIQNNEKYLKCDVTKGPLFLVMLLPRTCHLTLSKLFKIADSIGSMAKTMVVFSG